MARPLVHRSGRVNKAVRAIGSAVKKRLIIKGGRVVRRLKGHASSKLPVKRVKSSGIRKPVTSKKR